MVVAMFAPGLILTINSSGSRYAGGGWLVAVLAGGLAAYILWKFIQRRRFLRRLRIARITPKELMDELTAGETISLVDLRQPMDIRWSPARFVWPWKRSKSATERFSGIAISFSTVRDPRSDQRPCGAAAASQESLGFARSKAGSTLGSRTIFLSLPKAKEVQRALFDKVKDFVFHNLECRLFIVLRHISISVPEADGAQSWIRPELYMGRSKSVKSPLSVLALNRFQNSLLNKNC